MKRKLTGKKLGMTQLFDEEGRLVPCTVLVVEPNVVTQIKTVERDGYSAVQTAHELIVAKDARRREKRCKKPQRGHFAKVNVEPRRRLGEIKVDNVDDFEVGQELSVDLFEKGSFVDVTAISIGKGYQGVMKKHGFRGGPAAHGSKFHRRAGSTGMRSTPGRCLPGGKRASQMGNKRVTTQNLTVVDVDAEENLLFLKGAVPGPSNGIVTIASAVKKGDVVEKAGG